MGTFDKEVRLSVVSPYQRYFATQIQTASPAQLVVMLYDGLLRFLKQMQQSLEVGDVRAAELAEQRATAIIQELMATLNPDAGEVATNLLELYQFSLNQVLQARLRKDPQTLEGVLQVVDTLRGAWAQIALGSAVTAQHRVATASSPVAG